jgi:hypothetical protein
MSTLPAETDLALLQGIPNPFDDTVVHNPWFFDATRTPDISSIHESAERFCYGELEKVRREKKQRAVLIRGAAGSGKTHLVARLLGQFRKPASEILACYLPLAEIPQDRLWSSLRKYLVKDLLRSREGDITGLHRLLDAQLGGRLSQASAGGKSFLDEVVRFFGMGKGQNGQTPAARAREKLEKELTDKVEMTFGVRKALIHLFSESQEEQQDARDWLAGESLPEERLRRLGLSTDPLTDRQREQESQEVALSLLRLTTDQCPVVLFFDQLEGFQTSPRDQDGYHRFGQFVVRLRQEPRAFLLLITFLRADRREDLLKGVGEAHWARLVEQERALPPLDWTQCTQIVLQRMNAVPDLRKMREGKIAAGENQFWPLKRECVEAIFNKCKPACTPRELLHSCVREFASIVGPVVTDPTFADFLHTKVAQRRTARPKGTPRDALGGMLDGLPWLCNLLRLGYAQVKDEELAEQLPNCGLTLAGTNGERIGFVVCEKHPQVWMRFRQLDEAWLNHLRQEKRCRELILVANAGLDSYTQ